MQTKISTEANQEIYREGGVKGTSINSEFAQMQGATGASAYPPAVLLKVVLFAYSMGIDSPEGFTRYGQRFATVEPVFGNLRHNK